MFLQIPCFVALMTNRSEAGFLFAFVMVLETLIFYVAYPPALSEVKSINSVWDTMLMSYLFQPFFAASVAFVTLSQRRTIVTATKLAAEVKMRRVTNLSHDLRTPLNAALGISAILNGSNLSDGQVSGFCCLLFCLVLE
jgi:signal transduction histidine kinase